MRWIIEDREGTAQTLHDLAVGPSRLVRINEVIEASLVMGSGSPQAAPHEPGVGAAAGVAVARRHSGGGAVWLAPGEQLWVDVVVPTDDPMHTDDIRVAAHRIGDAWVTALGAPAETWREGMTNPAASRIACFAGVGPGEVMLGDRKLVGMSQRRTRDWSRFQCVAYHRWHADDLLGALDLASMPGELRCEVEVALRDRVAVLSDVGAPVVDGGSARVLLTEEWNRRLVQRFVECLDVDASG